jgi:hypothetical protein
MKQLALALAFLFVLSGCDRPKDGRILDFEDETQLDNLIWKCPVNMERTPAISGQGHFALTAYLLPGLYPGVEMHSFPGDWSGYKTLEFYLNAPEAAGETLHIRIDDKKSNEDFDSRYQGYRKIESGVRRVEIPLSEIQNGPKGRKLNLRRIHRIVIYLYKQDKRVMFTLDDLKLTK